MTDRFRMLPSYHYEDNTDGNLLKSVGKPLRDYKIEGNCFQDGTPSPDNPIDIQCCGEKTVNLFKGVEEYKVFSSNYETYGNGFKVATKLDGDYNSRLCFLLLDDGVFEWGETYTFSCDVSPSIIGMNSYFRIGYVEPDTGVWRDFGLKAINNISKCEITITLPSEPPEGFYKTTAYPYDVSECLALNINIQVATLGELGALTVTNIQLQKGDTATEFEPYGYKVPIIIEPKNIFPMNDFSGSVIWQNFEPNFEPKTYNLYLDEPLRKVGDYADYLDFKNGKVAKEITVKVEFTGDEDWVIYPNKTKTFQYIPSVGIMLKGICTHYSSIKSSNMDIENGFVMDYVRSFIISDVRYNTVDDFKAFLKSEYENGNPVTFYLKINAKTIETPITLPKILTEKHTNIISVGTTLQPSKVNYQYYKGGK